MIERNQEQTSTMPWRWLALVVVGLALVTIVLAGSRLAVAAAPVAHTAAAQAQSPAQEPVSNTLYLPAIRVCRIQQVQITGPSAALLGRAQTFSALVLPADVALPLTYTWQATGQAPIVHVGGLTDSVSFAWDLVGAKTVSLEVASRCGMVLGNYPLEVHARDVIAFERHYGELDPHDIWLLHADGVGPEINLTNTPDLDEGAPTWSPDGRFIAYSAGTLDGDDRAIYKINLETREVTPLTDGTYNDRWPAWSPKGDKIAFMRDSGPLGYDEIYIMNADGTNQSYLTGTDRGGSEFPAWSWDGETIAFISSRHYAGRDLYIMAPDGSNVQRVTPTDRPSDSDRRDEIYPSWSPDGWIYYTYRYRDYPADKTEYLYRIWPDGSNTTQVFGDTYDRYIASFAPNGNCFVFYSYLGGGDKEVWKWCNGFTMPLNLTNNDAGDEFCAWSPLP